MSETTGTIMPIRDLLASGQPGSPASVHGWVRTVRASKAGVAFIEVNDGSSLSNLQIVAEQTLPNFETVVKLATGSSIEA